jgi:outer membrane protein assembly factor BamB
LKSLSMLTVVTVALGALASACAAVADDWPMSGRDASRNAVSLEMNPPLDWQVEVLHDTGRVLKAAKNIKWQARLGSIGLGAPVVANGLVWVGTNNQNPRDPKNKGDASVLMCFSEIDGKFLYQFVSPRLKNDIYEDWPHRSMGSPLVEGDRLWLVTNRCEAICLDIGPLLRGQGEPTLLWKLDMIKEMGVFPRSSLMAMLPNPSIGPTFKDLIYVNTGNGRGENSALPAPDAPSLVCLNKLTGKVVWKDNSPDRSILLGQFANPLLIQVHGRAQVVMAQGDGWVRSFDAATGKLIWKCDLNLKSIASARRKYVVGTPVFHDNRIFLGLGCIPGYDVGGAGRFCCLDTAREGDISPELDDGPGKGKPNPQSGMIWQFEGSGPAAAGKKARKLGDVGGSCVVKDGLVYFAEDAGYIHCLDAGTGKEHWNFDLKDSVWSSPLWVDRKVYVATAAGDVFIFDHGKSKKEPITIDIEDMGCGSPVFANGILYLMTNHDLFAIREVKAPLRGPRPPFVPSPQDVVDKMLELAKVTKDDVVYDLGCGDGRIVVSAAKKYGCKAVGIDIDSRCVKMAEESAKQNKVDHLVRIEQEDLFNVDISPASVVTLYLVPSLNVKLIPKLMTLKPGSRIVSHSFDIRGMIPDRVISMVSGEDQLKRFLFLWTTPLKREGP